MYIKKKYNIFIVYYFNSFTNIFFCVDEFNMLTLFLFLFVCVCVCISQEEGGHGFYEES